MKQGQPSSILARRPRQMKQGRTWTAWNRTLRAPSVTAPCDTAHRRSISGSGADSPSGSHSGAGSGVGAASFEAGAGSASFEGVRFASARSCPPAHSQSVAAHQPRSCVPARWEHSVVRHNKSRPERAVSWCLIPQSMHCRGQQWVLSLARGIWRPARNRGERKRRT
eukprot:58059-Rhodomonas_salina.2